MKKLPKQVWTSIISLALAFCLAIGGAFAWFVVSRQPVSDIVLNIVDLENDIGNLIDIGGSTGLINDPISLFPGERNINSLEIRNQTQYWIKLVLTVGEVGILYGALPESMSLADAWYTDELGQKESIYEGTEVSLNDFVTPVSNALQFVAYVADDAPTSYNGFNFITAAAAATAQEKAQVAYNLLPLSSIVGCNTYCSADRVFEHEGIPYAYMTTAGEIFIRNSTSLRLTLALNFNAFQTTSTTLSDGQTVTEFSSNPFLNQRFSIRVSANLEAITDESLLPSI